MPNSTKKSLFRAAKLLKYFLIVMVLILTAIYFLSPVIINRLIQQQLAAAGLTSELVIDTPYSDHLTIPAMELRSNDPNTTASLHLSNVQINYHWLDLLSAQPLQMIQIETLTIRLAGDNPLPSAGDDHSLQQSINLANYLPGVILPQLPFASLQIKNIKLHWQKSSHQRLQLNGQLSIDQQTVELAFEYRENNRLLLNIDASLTANNDFDIQASAPPADALDKQRVEQPSLTSHLSGNIDLQQQQLLINTTWQLSLNHYPATSLWLPTLGENLTGKVLSNSDVQLHINQRIVAPLYFSTLDTWLNATAAESDFELLAISDKPSMVPLFPKLTLDKLQLTTTGTSHYKNQRLKVTFKPASQVTLAQINHPQLRSKSISLALSSPLAIEIGSPLAPLTTGLIVTDFSLLLTSESALGNIGKISHAPIKLQIDNIDLKNKQFNVEYQIPHLQLTNSSTLPFAQLIAQLQGSLSITAQSAQASLAAHSQIQVSGLALEQLSTKLLTINNNSPMQASLNFTEQHIVVSDQTLSLAPTQWQSPWGLLEHPSITVEIQNIDPANSTLQVNLPSVSLSLKARQLPVESIDLLASGSALISPRQILLTIDKNLTLRAAQISIAGYQSQAAKVRSIKPTTISVAIPTAKQTLQLNAVKISPISAVLTGSHITAAGQKLHYQSLRLDLQQLSLAPLRIQASTKLTGVALDKPLAIKNVVISATHNIAGNRHRAVVKVSSVTPAIKLAVTLNSRNNYQSITGQWKISPIDLPSDGPALLNSLRLSLPLPIEIVAGRYIGTGDFKVNRGKLTATAKHQLLDLAVTTPDFTLQDINSHSQTLYRKNKLSHRGELNIQRINYVIPIDNVHTKFNITNILNKHISLNITGAKANILAAKVQLKDLTIPLLKPRGTSILHFSGLPLNNILALEQQPSLVGTGTLAGKLPFTFIGSQLWIKDGDIHSTDNGYIRYQANDQVRAYAATNTGLSIALKVLENFHYKVLSINANYSPQGDLKLHNKLSGKNPHWQQGQPIEFAINIEENVLQLLKALQFSEQLTEKIQQRIKQSANAPLK